MVNFWSQRYKRWKPYNKLMFWLAIIAIIIGIFFGGKHIININSNNNEINIQNATLIKSPILQDTSNVSVTYTESSDFANTGFYKETFSYRDDSLFLGKKFDFYSIKLILPDDQEAFLEKASFNRSYEIALCNEEFTDCYIYHKFRIKDELSDDEICIIHKTRFGHDDLGSDIFTYTEKFKKILLIV